MKVFVTPELFDDLVESIVPEVTGLRKELEIVAKAFFVLFEQLPQKMREITPALRKGAGILWKNGKVTDEELMEFAKAKDLPYARDWLKLMHDTPFRAFWNKVLKLNLINTVFEKLMPPGLKKYIVVWEEIRDVVDDWIDKLEKMGVVKPK